MAKGVWYGVYESYVTAAELCLSEVEDKCGLEVLRRLDELHWL